MDPKDYTIISSENASKSENIIYNIKLTEELVEKLMKGQEDLNNLKGIEFSISDKGIDVSLKFRG